MGRPSQHTEGLFQPDVILPAQFSATVRRQALNKTGECQLLVAVLQDAVDCYQKYIVPANSHERRLFQEAEDWLMSDDEDVASSKEDAPTLSFEYVCAVLGLDSEYLRHGLRQWRERRLTSRWAAAAAHAAQHDTP